ncbi:hypothetical protein VPH35_008487 [Triticum aestivum]
MTTRRWCALSASTGAASWFATAGAAPRCTILPASSVTSRFSAPVASGIVVGTFAASVKRQHSTCAILVLTPSARHASNRENSLLLEGTRASVTLAMPLYC